ncbi:major facilitator transporter [Gallibacterium salpingitidis]|uniref:Major facilitator transporter n=1 Tax=Gallibacterium salpingitidis TaxID=505341 RepID=A0AB36E4H6_9PAST|nr:DHA2 family efflux MFS transporter permease subunit [Gallibacterium salpingitidis]OBX11700.1 major facilitator transporter [Gallibacterium salpingitidis]WKT00075.1 DHA2 family efflux MFS transporter permease subunit [Gallibacterium salpingitidis]
MAVALSKEHRGLAWIASFAFFMQTLDVTILNTALPMIAHDLHESPLNMQLTVISYALTVALFMPLSGWLADRHGTLTIFRYAVLLFVLGSVFCAMSGSLDILILSRIVQGIGGAIMMPVARLTLIKAVPKTELLPAWNLMAMAGLTGPILGPLLGGWLVTYASWHWIFLINIPVGLLGIFFARFYMPNLTGARSSFDRIGFVLFSGGIVLATLGLDFVGEANRERDLSVIFILIGALSLVGYVFYARGKRSVLFPLSVFFNRTFTLSMIGNVLIRLSASGVPFLLPLMLQIGLGYPADQAGMLMVPLAISSIIMKPIITRILTKFGYKRTLISASILLTFAVIGLGFIGYSQNLIFSILIIMFYGACISMIFSSVNTLMVSELKDDQVSAGTTLLSIVQQIGISLGIAVASVVLNLYHHRAGQQELLHSFSNTFFTLSVFGVLSMLTFLLFRSNVGESMHHKSNTTE